MSPLLKACSPKGLFTGTAEAVLAFAAGVSLGILLGLMVAA